MRIPLCFRTRAALRVLAGLALALIAATVVRADVRLDRTTFAADNLPTIHADGGDLLATQAYVNAGGSYKLRAKFIVPFDPGYYHGIDSFNNNGQRLTGSPGAGSYLVQLYWVAYTPDGQVFTTGPFYSVNVTVTAPATGNSGLQADYFNGTNFQTLARTAASGETPNYSWGAGGPTGTGTDLFSIRWSGQVEPLFTGTYTFTTGSDDGMRVFVSDLNNPVAGAYYDHGYLESSGEIQLNANTRYQIRVEFFENYGGADAKLFWEGPNQQREIVPVTRLLPPGASGGLVPPSFVTPPQSQTVNVGASVVFTVVANGSPTPAYQWRKNQNAIPGATGTSLTFPSVQPDDAGSYDVVATNGAGSATSPAATLTVNFVAAPGNGNGLRGDYFNGTGFNQILVSRTDATVDFSWGGGSPAAGVGSDNFSVRWTGQIEAPVTGSYTFSTNNDDGVQLWVDGRLLIDDWSGHAPADRFSAPISLTAGTKYNITLAYFENGGGANVTLYWDHPGQVRTVIPQSRLYSPPIGGGGGGGTSGWQNLIDPVTATIYHHENFEEDGSSNWASTENDHAFYVPSPGTLRIYTRGQGDSTGHLIAPGFSTGLDGGGEGENFFFEGPVTEGNHRVYVTCRHQWSETDQYTLYVEFIPSAGPPSITSTLNASVPVGANFNYQITASSTLPVTYEVSGLPGGLSATSAGAIFGIPTQGGTFNLQLTARNSAGADTETLQLTTYFVTPSIGVSANKTGLSFPGDQVELTVYAQSAGQNLRFLNLNQVSPRPGHYGQGETGTEIPPNDAHFAVTDSFAPLRRVLLTLNEPGLFRFKGAASDGVAWYENSNEVSVAVPAQLTVQNGSGSGYHAVDSTVSVTATPPGAGASFTGWTVLSGDGVFANATSASTTFTLGRLNTVIRADFTTGQAPAIVTPPTAQSVVGGQNAAFVVSATGSPTLMYQWRRNGTALSDGPGISGSTTPQLTLGAVTASATGNYDVVVTNAFGSATSSAAPLTVSTPATIDLLIHRP